MITPIQSNGLNALNVERVRAPRRMNTSSGALNFTGRPDMGKMQQGAKNIFDAARKGLSNFVNSDIFKAAVSKMHKLFTLTIENIKKLPELIKQFTAKTA